jgi:acetyl-CoA synthetase
MISHAASYDELRASFAWQIPQRFNMAQASVERHVGSGRTAVIHDDGTGAVREITFEQLSSDSNRLASALEALGVARGDRVAIFLTNRPESILTHLAAWKLGAISQPLTTLFGPDALIQRLGDAAPRVIVCEPEGRERLIESVLPSLDSDPILICVDDEGRHGFERLLADGADVRRRLDNDAEDPAFLSFTSGTTGPAKGTLHAHRNLLGHIPGLQLAYDLLPQPGDVAWTPADWSWMGGFMNVVFNALYWGLPVVSAPRRFDPDEAWSIVARHDVTFAFLPATAMRLMRQADPASIPARALRAIASGGESLDPATREFYIERLGCAVNEFYGQTEANTLIANCTALFEAKPGSMGRAVPGHRVEILDEDLKALGPDEIGEICVADDTPVAFLEYLNNPEATARKRQNGWIRTGDVASRDSDGYFRFRSRNDDVISSAGYRIGPTEIEECLVKHEAVMLAAAIGVPDETRGEVVKAFIQLRDGYTADPELKADVQAHVRRNLAAYLYPREIDFIDEIPLTTTGKVKRSELRERERSLGAEAVEQPVMP